MKHLFNKLSAFIVMLMCVSATVQAQTYVTEMIVTKKNGEVTRFNANNIAKVEWTNENPVATTGTEKATINGNEVDVPWVQLWKDGPKFAEYNVGAENNKAEDYGGYYCWGSSIDKDPKGAYKIDSHRPTGDDDTATKLWGSNWRMPTAKELCYDLLDNCDAQWTTINGVNGRKFTGKGDYKDNSVFLPAAGDYFEGDVHNLGKGYYWSTDPYNIEHAFSVHFDSNSLERTYDFRGVGLTVRAVLAE